ncbi:MAG: TetR/AcrR family transcriptional regulator [Spirochaetales bacterium]|nr:TetR/AcrR family transcriptional regulator [Spirochaetales bacterium]
MARVTKSVEERHKEIVDTAEKLFKEKGFQNTQISDIAKEIGVSQGLVYHYFKSKTEMLYEVIDQIAERKQMAINEPLNDSTMKASEKLKALLNIRLASDDLSSLMPGISNDQGAMEYIQKKMAAASEPMLVSLIEQGNSDGSWKCDHPAETARFILWGASGFIDKSISPDVNSKQKDVLIKMIIWVLSSFPMPIDGQ